MDIFDIMDNEVTENVTEKVTEKPKKVSVFDYIKQINSKTEKHKFDSKACSSFILALHYSHNNRFLGKVNKINKFLNSFEPKLVYDYFYNEIPKNDYFIRWVKKNEEKENAYEKLMEKYNISRREAELSFLGLLDEN